MSTDEQPDRDPGVAPECAHLVETVETLIELERSDQAQAVMQLMRRCIRHSDCPHSGTCNAALRRLEGEFAA